jgi:hypothetical protein
VWNVDDRTEVLKILASNPEVRVGRPGDTLYDAMVAAELDEPGALAALVALKLSDNAQFRDLPGACKLMETAAARGDQTFAAEIAKEMAKCGGADRGAGLSGVAPCHDRYRHQAENQGQDQDRAAAPAQGDPGQ